MDVYSKPNEEGVLDLHKAQTQLEAARGINNTDERRKIVAEINTAALLDIAASLRPLAAEVRDAQLQTLMTGGVSYLPSERDEDETPAWTLLDVGSWVEWTEADDGRVGKIVEIGIREGEPSARVQWYDRTGNPMVEKWSFLASLVETNALTLSDDEPEPESAGSQIMDGVPLTVETDDERRQRVDREREERIAAAKANPEPEPEAAPASTRPDPMFSIGADDDASPAAELRANSRAVDIDGDFGDADPLAVLKAKTKAPGKKSGKAKKKGSSK